MLRNRVFIAIQIWVVFFILGAASTFANAETNSQNKTEFHITHVKETIYADLPAIEIAFSEKLKSNYYYDALEVYLDNKKISGSWVVSDDHNKLYLTNIQPQKTYRLKVIPSKITNEDDRNLGGKQEFEIATSKLAPAYGFAGNGNILSKGISEGLPIITVNVKEVDIEFLRIKPERLIDFLENYNLPSVTYLYDIENISKKYTEIAYSGRFEISGYKDDQQIKSQINLEKISELEKPGLYLAVMKAPGKFSYYLKTAYFSISDIGLHIRKYNNEIDIYTTSLKEGTEKGNVNIKLFSNKSRVLSEAKTDDNGFATISTVNLRKNHSPSFVVAQKENSISFLKINGAALDLSEFNISGRSQQKVEAYIYSSRDLFRPGETAPISVIVKDHDGRQITPSPMTVEIRKPDGNVYKKFSYTPNKNGYIETNVWFPDNAPTGNWRVQVKNDPSDKSYIASTILKVEEFLPERLKMELNSQQESYKTGEKIDVSVKSDYLYGAPASKNRVTAVTNIFRNTHPIPKYGKYYFGDVEDNKINIRNNLIDAKLDDNGKIALSVPALKTKYSSVMSVATVVSVFESGGRPIVRSKRNDVWPTDTLIGIKPLFERYAPYNADANFEVIAVNSKGEMQSVKNLQTKVFYEDRHYNWYYDSSSGWRSTFSATDIEQKKETISVSKNSPTKLSFNGKHYGHYRIEVYNPETKLTTKYRYRVGWRDIENNSSTPTKVKLSLDKKGYKPGDTIKLKVTPPHAGNGFIIVESNKRLWRKKITVSESGGTFNIPVSKDWNTHNIYITAVIFRPGSKNDLITPNRAIGLIHMPLDRDDKHLTVSIETPEKMEPLNKIEVKVKIDNLNNRKATITVAAVDSGVLNITNFNTPNPFNYFFSKRRYEIDSIDLFNKVIEVNDYNFSNIKFGGGAESANKRNAPPKAKVKIVSLFSGAVDVDKDGIATIKMDVPDFNGELRIMAVAFGENSFGSAEKKTIVASPVIAELSTPRFIAHEDVAMAALDLQNLSGKEQEITVDISTTAPLKQINKSEKVTLKDKEKTTLFFEIEGDKAFGVGNINIDVNSSSVAISKNWQLAVKPPYPNIEFTKKYTYSNNGKLNLKKEWINNLLNKTVNVRVSASILPPIDLKRAIDGLFGYPYGCLEQTMSKAYPNLYLNKNISASIDIKPISQKEKNKRVAMAISRLRGMQLSNGSFGLWNKNSPEEPWLTPYVAEFLIKARDQGYDVPEDMLNAVINNLSYRLRNGNSNYNSRYSSDYNHLKFAAQAYAAYSLSLVNKANLSSLRNMYEYDKDKAKSGLPLVHLGLALIQQGDNKRGMAAIKKGIKMKRNDHYYGDYGSDLRDSAMMFSLLSEKSIDIKNNLIFDISDQISSRYYLSTQEKIAIFRAGYQSISDLVKSKNMMITISEDLIDERVETRNFNRSFSADDINSGINISFSGEKPIYTQVFISGYTKKEPKSEQNKIKITRNYYTMDGKHLNKRMFKTGEMVLVHLNVKAYEYICDAIIIDQLPAGFEIENLNISQGEKLGRVSIAGTTPANAMGNNSITHVEYRDDRFVAAAQLSPYSSLDLFYIARVVSPGSYQTPPTFAEDMYRPDIRSIGERQKPITVTNPDN